MLPESGGDGRLNVELVVVVLLLSPGEPVTGNFLLVCSTHCTKYLLVALEREKKKKKNDAGADVCSSFDRFPQESVMKKACLWGGRT